MGKEILIKSLKEFGRVVVIAIIPVLISSLENNTIDLKVLAVVGAIAGLKFIDKLLHEIGVEIENDTDVESSLTKGITRF